MYEGWQGPGCTYQGGPGTPPHGQVPLHMAQYGSIWLIMGPIWLIMGPIWLIMGPIWLIMGPDRVQMGPR